MKQMYKTILALAMTRYYLPELEIMSGEWTMPHPAKVETD